MHAGATKRAQITPYCRAGTMQAQYDKLSADATENKAQYDTQRAQADLDAGVCAEQDKPSVHAC
jgi:hypothetical protein